MQASFTQSPRLSVQVADLNLRVCSSDCTPLTSHINPILSLVQFIVFLTHSELFILQPFLLRDTPTSTLTRPGISSWPFTPAIPRSGYLNDLSAIPQSPSQNSHLSPISLETATLFSKDPFPDLQLALTGLGPPPSLLPPSSKGLDPVQCRQSLNSNTTSLLSYSRTLGPQVLRDPPGPNVPLCSQTSPNPILIPFLEPL